MTSASRPGAPVPEDLPPSLAQLLASGDEPTVPVRVQLSRSFFDRSDLYVDAGGACGNATCIVNNSNSSLSFGGGGTNGAIRRFFFPGQARLLCGLVRRRGRQHRDKWRQLAGGLIRDYPREGGNGGLIPDADLLPHAPGSIWHTPLPAERRQGTNVQNIIHVVGPKNDSTFVTKDDAPESARNRAADIVYGLTSQVLRLAFDELGAQTLILAGISTGIFAQGDPQWAAAMYAAMRRAIGAHVRAATAEAAAAAVAGAGAAAAAAVGGGNERKQADATGHQNLNIILVGKWEGA